MHLYKTAALIAIGLVILFASVLGGVAVMLWGDQV